MHHQTKRTEIMREDQTIDFIRKGFVNTIHASTEDVKRALALHFGDGTLNVVKDDKEENALMINVKNLPYVMARYDRNITIRYAKRGDKNHPIQVTEVVEEESIN